MSKRRRPPIVTADEVLVLRRKVVTAAAAKRIGDARRVYEAELRSGWDSYQGAIEAARARDVSRLVDCLRARKLMLDDDRNRLAAYIATKARRLYWPPELVCALGRSPTEDDYDYLADFVEMVGCRPGGVFDVPVHRAARLAEVLMSLVPGRVPAVMRTAVIEYACEIEGAEADVAIDPDRVRDLLNRPKARRHKH